MIPVNQNRFLERITMFQPFGKPCCAALLLLAGAATLGGNAAAQNFPTKPIRIVMPFTPGGSTDLLARVIAQKMTEKWGPQNIVDNKPGAATIVATEFMAKSPPDGYTMLFVTTAFAINPSLYKKLPYDTVRDFAPVVLMTSAANVLVAHPALPANSVRELIKIAKTRPGELTYASAGSGTAAHVSIELLQTMAGIKLEHVPYKGIPQASVDVMSGQVSMLITSLPNALPYMKMGKMKALGLTTAKRSAIAPAIPTIAESGVPGYEASGWQGMITVAGTPRDIINKLNAEIVAILQMPDVREKLAADGSEFIGSSPEQFAAHLKSEISKWAKVVQDSGAKVD
jgi:tripartite-type tricarboxylate transporter receptor subunit TctC